MWQKMTALVGLVAVHGAFVAAAIAPPTQAPTVTAKARIVQARLLPQSIRDGQPVARQTLTTVPLLIATNVAPPHLSALKQAARSATAESPYLPSNTLERRPVPVSEPDLGPLTNLTTTGLPIRLRIYISRVGKVDDVQVREGATADTWFVKQVVERFQATLFIPGRHHGVDVPSFMDIELAGDLR